MLSFLANKACECYVALCDWPAVLEWQVSVLALKKGAAAGNMAAVQLKTDFNYVRALSRFEDGDFPECRAQLELLPGDDYGLLNAAAPKDKLGKRAVFVDGCGCCLYVCVSCLQRRLLRYHFLLCVCVWSCLTTLVGTKCPHKYSEQLMTLELGPTSLNYITG